MRSVHQKIWQTILRHGKGWVFTPHDFRHLAKRTTIDQSLFRLKRKGKIRNLAHGIYDYPRIHPELGLIPPRPSNVAKAVAAQTGSRLQLPGPHAANAVGLSTQIPMTDAFITDGPSRNIRAGKATITLQHVSPKKLFHGYGVSGLALQALHYFGPARVTDQDLRQIARLIPKEDRQQLLKRFPLAPHWMQAKMRILQEIQT